VNSLPSVNEMLALLDALKQNVRDFVAREDKLESDFRVATAAELRDFTGRTEAQEATALTRQLDAGMMLKQEQEKCDAKFERRKVWINKAHSAVSRRVHAKIGEEDSQLKERTQQGVQQAEIRRDESLANATANYNSFQQDLAVAGERIVRLEQSAGSEFRGYGKFRQLLAGPRQSAADASEDSRRSAETPPPADEHARFAELKKLEGKISDDLSRFNKFPLPKIFKFLPVWLLAAVFLAMAAADPVLAHFGKNIIPHVVALAALAAFVVTVALYFIGGSMAAPLAKMIASDLAKARRLFDVCVEKSAAHLQSEQERIKNEFDETKRAVNAEWRQATKGIAARRGEEPMVIAEKAARLSKKHDHWHRVAMEKLQKRHEDAVAQLKAVDLVQFQALSEAHEIRVSQIEGDYQQRWQELETDWKNALQPLGQQLQAVNDAAERMCPDWNAPVWKEWKSPVQFQNAVKFGRLEGNVEKFSGPLPKNPRLKWPGPAAITAPLSLVFPRQGSILFESGKAPGDEAFPAINNIIFRLLSTTPPGKLTFTILDPVGLGQNFSALTHLADYDESALDSRIWTQAAQFEEKLAELNEHMEKIIQMYLRNEYATIADYNAQAGSVAEKYHFLVIASFPVNFSEAALKRLRNITANGARCGVFTLIHWDQRTPLPQDFVPDEMRKNSVCLVRGEGGFEIQRAAGVAPAEPSASPAGAPPAARWNPPGVKLLFDAPPPAEFATDFLQRVGELSKNSTRVEVPFEQVAPENLWQDETTELLRVPIGRSGATKLQYLEIGSGTRQHALIAGKTGSGKSTLFHIIITNLALRCSPEQVEFYLVDFKKGVEFKCYGTRHLPHAKVVAIESDREFGLSVLQRVDEELRRRGDLFRQVGAQDLAGYKRAGGTEPVPRSLLMIDEFQEFFTEEDRVSQGAAVLLDRIVRQGRAFGIHVILGSQTLGGAFTLARATIGQMVIRIALMCNEADAYLIMDQDNPAPRLLSRPGEGIYNDAAGAIEGNSPFQAVWLSDKTRDAYLEKVRIRADEAGSKYPGPIVFEGNAPADVRENYLLNELLATPADRQASPTVSRVWLGAPNSIKGPTEAKFQRQSGSNLLIVGQSDERTNTLLCVALVSLAAQMPKAAARFVVLDGTPPGFPQRDFLERIVRALPQETILAGNANVAETMSALAEELKLRGENESARPEIFVLIQGLQNFKKLRQEDEFSFSSSSGDGPNPAAILQSLITDGPPRGIHVITACDTYNNVNRFLGRKALTEFENRVVFQMSASDSASLIDSPSASTLGLHRALFYNDREGSTETFRPYAQPGGDWLEEIERRLGAR
jgi:DNA segregation ATPase FtsK/SpoIIIE, S-DNA-T family